MKKIILLSGLILSLLNISDIVSQTRPVIKGNMNIYDLPSKIIDFIDRKPLFFNYNNIAVEVFNYGGISPGYGLIRGLNNYVWNNSSYLFQVCPIVGASVADNSNPEWIYHIISDGVWEYPNYREVNPTGDTLWTFEPIPGFDDSDQQWIAHRPDSDLNSDGKPDSWPQSWYDSVSDNYEWPELLKENSLSPEMEIYWVMDDRNNREFPYFPFSGNIWRRGLGIEIIGRIFQWNVDGLSDALLIHYTVTNASEKNLDTVFFGLYTDIDAGGYDNEDDCNNFIPPNNVSGYPLVNNIPTSARNLVYFVDSDSIDDIGVPLGLLGVKFLETPGNSFDGIDNDGDGLIDESQNDGIDNDGDWDPVTDDVGIDGIPNTGDEGDGDGYPTAGILLPNELLDPQKPGEPNFEYTDYEEKDQIGMTSLLTWVWATASISNDEHIWILNKPGEYCIAEQCADILSILGSGYFSLPIGKSVIISAVILSEWTLDELISSASRIQKFYNSRFTSVPVSVNGDKSNFSKVTSFELYQNHPNPFNPITKINYALPQSAVVELQVYNVLGQEIVTLVNQEKPAGSYEVEFNAADLPSGVYFYQLKADSYVETKKMLLLK